MSNIIIAGDIGYCPEAQAVINFSGNPELFKDSNEPVTITAKGKAKSSHKIAPWGQDNDLPTQIMEKIDSSEVVGSNVKFNIDCACGQGIKPLIRKVVNGKTTYEDCTDEEVLNFFEDNDINGYFMEQLTDMVIFNNVFPEIVLSQDGKKIVSLRHDEAVFSRWGSKQDGEAEIARHFYGVWENGQPKDGKFNVTPVLSRFHTYQTLKDLMARGCKDRRFVLQVAMPTPGRTYYARPYWWSIFLSGWYDVAKMLPNFKKALLKNHLAVRYIVYVSEAYWDEQIRIANLAVGDTEGERKVREQAAKQIQDFLLSNEKGGGLITSKRYVMGGNGKQSEDKYIEIQVIEPGVKGGEFIEDSEEASNIISYAMGVHPNLNGATPGKSKGSMGGSDKRELFMIKQAMMRPSRDRLLLPLSLIKRYNNWPKDLVFAVPEYQFPTQDVTHSGQQTTVQNP